MKQDYLYTIRFSDGSFSDLMPLTAVMKFVNEKQVGGEIFACRLFRVGAAKLSFEATPAEEIEEVVFGQEEQQETPRLNGHYDHQPAPLELKQQDSLEVTKDVEQPESPVRAEGGKPSPSAVQPKRRKGSSQHKSTGTKRRVVVSGGGAGKA